MSVEKITDSPEDAARGSLKQHGSAWTEADIAQITSLAYALLASTQSGWFASFCWLMAALYMVRSVLAHVTRKTPNAPGERPGATTKKDTNAN